MQVTSRVFTPALFRSAISDSVNSNLTRLAALLERHADRNEGLSSLPSRTPALPANPF
jgi:hypothetical protein